MPPLTWRDTVAPDFSTTLGAVKQTGAALSQGLGGLGDALGKFNDYSQGQNASALMANAVKYTNPADLQAAFANGSIYNGVNPGYLTADALKSTQGQVGTLLTNAANTETNAFNASADPLRISHLQDQQKVDAGTLPARILAPTYANDKMVADTGSVQATTAGQLIANTQSNTMNPLLVDQQKQRLTAGDITNTGAQLGLTEAQRLAADNLAARPLINQLGNFKDADSLNAFLASPDAMALSPGARQQLIQASQSTPYSGMAAPGVPGGSAGTHIAGAVGAPTTVYDPVPTTGGASGSISRTVAATPSLDGTAGTKNGSMYDMTLGGHATPVPVSTSKIGDVVEYGRNKMIPSQGGSPTGAYQITADTLDDFGPKVFGADWKSKTYSPENQDKLGEAIFNASKNGNLKARWDSLPDATPGAYANKTWPEMRSIITKGEVGQVDPSGGSNGIGDPNSIIQDAKRREQAVNTAAAKTTTGLGVGSAQNEANAPEAAIYQPQIIQDRDAKGNVIGQHMGPAPIDDNAPMGVVLTRLINSSAFQGVAPETLENTLQETMKTAHVKAAAAAVIMESHPEAAGWVRRNIPYFMGGYNFKPNDEETQKGAQSVARGTASDTAISSAVSGVTQSRVTAGATEVQNAARALAAAVRDPAMAGQVPGLQAKLTATEQLFHAVNDAPFAEDSMNQRKWNPDGTLIDRHNKPTTATTPDPTPTPAPAPVPGDADAAISAAIAADPDIQAKQAKSQAAQDRLSAAQSRNDPKLVSYRQAANKASQILQDTITSRKQDQVRQVSSLDDLEARGRATFGR